MERKLGISLYPEHSTKEKDMAYISAAARHGFFKNIHMPIVCESPERRNCS